MKASLRQLQVFAAVAEAGSVTRAAEQLHLSQPAVSQQLRQLNEAIGEPVFDSLGRGISLNATGQRLLETWVTIEEQWRQFEESLTATRLLQQGTLRIAVVSTAKYFIPRMLGEFWHHYPGIEVRLEVANRDQIVERIKANTDDLYVMTQPPEAMDLVCEPFLDNPLVVIAPRGHALAERGVLTMADLQEERFILRERGSGTRYAIQQAMQEAGTSLNMRMELGSNEAIKEAVAGGLGLSILSRHTLHRNPGTDDGVVILPVQGFPILSRWQLVYLRKRQLPHSAVAFKAELAKWLPMYASEKGLVLA
jgi:DNA-binding transcriptional LysR family regulator